jgi:ribokinase
MDEKGVLIMGRILVVGSINMDIVNHVIHHPQPGETIKGTGTEYSPGGKGANQAAAASLSGGEVSMIGAVGQDAFGPELIANLRKYGVKTNRIMPKAENSGMAFITVDHTGENHIILSEGANGKLTSEDIESYSLEYKGFGAVLLQNEIDWAATEYVIRTANQQGVHVYFNPAPAMAIPDDVISCIDTLILNESEAELISGLSVKNEEQAKAAAEFFIDKGIGRVILTLGSKGALCLDKEKNEYRVAAYSVAVVDTTAAGDTFIGAFAAASESGEALEDCLHYASAAAALAVTKRGAQVSIPDREEICFFLRENKPGNV